jgi:anti-sigma-K factor RskA
VSDIHALSGAYAVDALDEHERALFEQHLADCGDCRAEVDSLREAAATLPSTTPATPPPSVRAAVLAGISTVRPLPPVLPVARARRTRRLPRLLAAAAAVVAVAGAGVVVTQPWEDDAPPPSAAERVIEASDARSVTVRLDGASATVYHSASQGKAAIVTDDLPALPADKVYELWLQVDGDMVPAGLMPAAGDQELLLEGDASDATAAGISVEPAGGSRRPTTVPIALFDLTRAR